MIITLIWFFFDKRKYEKNYIYFDRMARMPFYLLTDFLRSFCALYKQYWRHTCYCLLSSQRHYKLCINICPLNVLSWNDPLTANRSLPNEPDHVRLIGPRVWNRTARATNRTGCDESQHVRRIGPFTAKRSAHDDIACRPVVYIRGRK